MPSASQFSGVIAPVLTPFNEDGSADADRFVEHALWLLEDGCTGLAPFGTTSEANSLALEERMDLLEALIEEGIEPEKLMPGTGTCSLMDTATLTQHAVDLGCGGVLMLPPFYYKDVTEDGLYRYYSEIVEEVGLNELRVYLYHIPQVSGVPILPGLVERLRKSMPNHFVGMKDSSGNVANSKMMIDQFPGFDVLVGNEKMLLEGMRAGAKGTITATANVAARRIFEAFSKWQGPEAEEEQKKISAQRDTFAGPMIPALKSVIAHYAKDPQWKIVRAPLMPMPEPEAMTLIAKLESQHGLAIDFSSENGGRA